MNRWVALVTSLPTENATARMRAWRNLKASGAAVLRDGVYLLPERDACRATLAAVAADILSSGGTALLLEIKPPPETVFEPLFARTDAYAALCAEMTKARESLSSEATATAIATTEKQLRKLRKAFATLSAIDFFPGEARRQSEAALLELEAVARRLLSPDEPHAVDALVPALDRAAYRGRRWATRRRPWVDRLASAWLIRRFIDPAAPILWLASPADCPADALGFDFDGAAFSHAGIRVTFEVLLASFALSTPALQRLAAVVHFLDVGGLEPPEALGVECVLAGWRATFADDDQLLAAASRLFDGLLTSFEQAEEAK